MRATIFFPDHTTLDNFIQEELPKTYTYPEVGATKTNEQFAHYDNDNNQVIIGKGAEVWQKAKCALKNWQQFPLPWTKIYPNTTALEEGEVVVVLFRLFGIWWRNSAKIVYAFDEPNRFGFAYGTLPGHIETGEEVFWVEKDAEGVVSYHIKAFSTPRFWLARIAYPVARFFQRKFVKESKVAMQKLVKESII